MLEKEDRKKELERKTTHVCINTYTWTPGAPLEEAAQFFSVDCRASWMEVSDQSKVTEHNKGKILHQDKHTFN